MAVETDAFTGGIAPGGLRTKNDIRILLCYLLSSVGAVSYTHLFYKNAEHCEGQEN